ncbi:YdaU family protein [Noviherbaspirillum aerium]|uniref:YdaU family protein n=1 Tax=Noviherbaspirillum aerium TaxID=2588497 RepID=UPI00124ED932|nr:YdaU family protein [Noviherbaspirillum aerium]
MNFYKHFIGDYARATGHLSIVEHGAYRLMLDHFYGSCRPLPANKKALYRLLRAENDGDRKSIDTVSLRFWRPLPEDVETVYGWLGLHTEEDQGRYRRVALEWEECGGLVNVRALGEIVKAAAIADRNRQIAIEREAKKRNQVGIGGAA